MSKFRKKQMTPERRALLESFFAETNGQMSLADMAADMVSFLLEKERELYLNQPHPPDEIPDKANGFYSRDMATKLGTLALSVPRVRSGDFRSLLLPHKWQRGDAEFDQFILQLLLASYSPNTMKALLKELALPYSSTQIEEMVGELHERAQDYFTRELPTAMLAVFIDGFHTTMKHPDTKKAQKVVIYVALGLDQDGFSHLLGFWASWGAENRETWMKHLNALIARGLTHPMMLISDDLPGLTQAIATLFPHSEHQLCWTHFLRSLKKHLSKEDYRHTKDILNSCKLLDFSTACTTMTTHLTSLKESYYSCVEYHLPRIPHYLQFLTYPKQLHRYLYTTNKVESFNSLLRRTTHQAGGYFQSLRSLEVAVFVIIQQLLKKSWKHSNKNIVGLSYEIHQLFYSKFPSQTQFF